MIYCSWWVDSVGQCRKVDIILRDTCGVVRMRYSGEHLPDGGVVRSPYHCGVQKMWRKECNGYNMVYNAKRHIVCNV